MTKIRSILKSTKDTNGRCPILLCISDRGKRAYFSTGFSATEKEFETTKEGGRFIQGRGVKTFYVTRKEEDGSSKNYTNKEANDKLAKIEDRASKILEKYNEDHISWGFEQFRSDFVNAPKRSSFVRFAEDIIEKEYVSRGRYKSATVAQEAIRSLKLYDTQVESRSFQDVNVKFLNGYIDYCRDKGNSDSTIKIRLGEIRRIFNIAIREKVITRELYPFSSGKEDGKVRIPKAGLNRMNQYLTFDSLKKLAEKHFENYVLERTKHLFLFSFYCRGINWKDMALLKKENFYKATVTDASKKKSKEVTIMHYRRAKTMGEFNIQVNDNIQKELDWFKDNTMLYDDYVLPIIRIEVKPEHLDTYLSQVRKRFNTSLRTIAKELKLEESQLGISSYTARHSFAMRMKELDKSVDIISEALGHQSVETTKHYLAKFSTTRMAEETDIDLFAKPKKSKGQGTKKARKP